MKQRSYPAPLAALIGQSMRFAIVGGLAATTHFLAVVLLVSTTHLVPLMANVLAFLLAFSVSYHGHRHWTFAESTTHQHTALQRFFMVAVLSFVLNEGLFYLLLAYTRWHYAAALLLVLALVPPLTFALSKVWAFR